MPLSAKEKQQRYRAKRDQDPVRRAQYLNKERERNAKKKAENKVLPIKALSERGKRRQRKTWRDLKRRRRQKLKDAMNALTPPQSPVEDHIGHSRQKNQARIKKRRNDAKASYENEVLRKELQKEHRKVELYKKRWLRERQHTMSDTPRSKTRKLLRNFSHKTVKKTLLFHHALVDEIKEKYKFGRKKDVLKCISGNILKKYRYKSAGLNALGIVTRRGKTMSGKCTSLSKRIKDSVAEFYLRDDNSRLLTGKKLTITFQKKRKSRKDYCWTPVRTCTRNSYQKIATSE